MVAPRKTMPFVLGRLLSTPAALDAVSAAGQHPLDFLARHASCDWGEVSAGDSDLNDQATLDGSRILSAYRTSKGVRLWVVTERDRSATTLLLPSEY